jgi:hypothetical protein
VKNESAVLAARTQRSTDNQSMSPTPTPGPNPSVSLTLPSDVISKLIQHDPSPNWAEKWTAYANLGLLAAAIAAGLFTYFGIKQARGIQHAQTFLEISRRWNEEIFRQGRIRIRNMYDPNGKAVDVTEGLKKLKLDNEEQYWESLMTLDFFETMAMNIRYKSITFEMVLELMGKAICTYWDMLSNHISEERAKDDNPKLYIEFQTLAIQIAAAREIKSTSGYVRHRQVRRAQKLRAPDPATPAQETPPAPADRHPQGHIGPDNQSGDKAGLIAPSQQS